MAKIDISLWTNIRRLRERVKNVATMVMSITAVNGFYMVTEKNWILLGINCIFFLTMIPLFMSYSRFQKEPPKEGEE